MNTKNNLHYDKTDPISIYEYAIPLIEHTLREIVGDAAVAGYNSKNKGELGQMVEELYYHYKPNSSPEPDFREAGVELKTTGLKELKDMTLQIKERLVVDMINYNEVVNQTFEMSLFYKKFRLLLLLFYLYEKGVEQFDRYFLYVVLWKIPEKDLLIIKHDYEVIINKIKKGEAHKLSEGDTEYLGACRKGNKNSKLRKQPFSEVLAPGRAFSLKPAYMRTVLEFIKTSKKKSVVNFKYKEKAPQIATAAELRNDTFENIVLRKFDGYRGLTYEQLCFKIGRRYDSSKDKYARISSRIVMGQFKVANLSEEFKKAGLQLKTIRIEADGGINESMSFENINYSEVYDTEDWYDSRLYEIFSGRFLFALFRADGGHIEYYNNQGNLVVENTYAFDKAFFWTMPVEDLKHAEKYWKHIRQTILNNHIHPDYFNSPKNKRFHVRPKGKNASDLAVNPNDPEGAKVKKYCYWFNNDYVKEIVKNNV